MHRTKQYTYIQNTICTHTNTENTIQNTIIMQHTEDNIEQNTDTNNPAQDNAQPQRTFIHTYSLDYYHEYVAIKNSNTIELYTISK